MGHRRKGQKRWVGKHSVFIVKCLKCESGSSCFQPGEGPIRGLLRDYEPSDGTFSSTSKHHRNKETEDGGANTLETNITTYNFPKNVKI